MIRRTKQADLPEILKLVKEFHLESLNKYDLFLNEEVINKIMPAMVETSFVLEVNGEIKGVIAGFFDTHILDNEKLFHEVIWYVSKEYRGRGAGLLSEMEQYCRDKGVKYFVMINMGDSDKVFSKFYKSQGFKKLETQWIKTL